MQSWLDFWNRKHRIYVNQRHLEAHYRRIADDVLSLLPDPAIELLDWGCGSALGARDLAQAGVRVTLYDRAPSVQAELEQRYGTDPRIQILPEPGLAAVAAGRFDVVLVNSVIQYLAPDELGPLLAELHRVLKPGGRLLLGDVIPPSVGLLDDVRSLLASAVRHGYLAAALGSLLATFFSDYRSLRRHLGLSLYRPEQMLEVLRQAGFAARQLPRNIGFASHRTAFEGRRG